MDSSPIGYMTCYKCGNTIPVDSEFCPFCGIKLFVTCPKCGHRHSSQYPICNKCGTNRENYLAEQRRLEQMRMIEEQRRRDEEERRKREEQKRAEEERLRKETELKRAEEEKRRLELKRQEEEKQRKARVIWKELTGSVNGTGIQTWNLLRGGRALISDDIKAYIKEIKSRDRRVCVGLLDEESYPYLDGFDEILLKNIVIPKGVECVDGFCYDYRKIRSIIYLYKESDAVLSAIYAMVQSVEIPDSVEIIGVRAFSRTSIKNIEIPDSIKVINEGAFTRCLYLESFKSTHFCPCGDKFLIVDNTLVAIAINGINFSVFELPTTVKRIGKQVFADCTSLKMIDIPDSVESIGGYAFMNCTSLEKVIMSNRVKCLDSSIFWGCTSLKIIDIPDSVESIGNYAFKGCASIEDIIIPSSVKSIGNCAFQYCEKLNRVTFRGVPQIDKSAFEECGALSEVIVPKGSRDYFVTILPEETRIVEM